MIEFRERKILTIFSNPIKKQQKLYLKTFTMNIRCLWGILEEGTFKLFYQNLPKNNQNLKKVDPRTFLINIECLWLNLKTGTFELFS